jgi:Flp pilus assembly protein TadG
LRRCSSTRRRRAALILESAVVYPVMIVLLLGLVICGVAVFRYQQVACQAREVARWASVRGADFQRDTGSESPTQNQILQGVLLPLAAGMATESLSLQVQWIDQATGTAYDWDSATKEVKSVTASGEYVTNTIRVTVSYQWSPNLLGMGPFYLSSTSEIPMVF